MALQLHFLERRPKKVEASGSSVSFDRPMVAAKILAPARERAPAAYKRKREKAGKPGLEDSFARNETGDALKGILLALRHQDSIQDHSLRKLESDPQAAFIEIERTLGRLPRDGFAEEKLKLLELAERLPGMGTQAADQALQLASGELHSAEPGTETPFEKFALPMGAFEVFMKGTSDTLTLIQGTVRTLRAHENPAARRLLTKFFSATRPELVDELRSELDRQGIQVPVTAQEG